MFVWSRVEFNHKTLDTKRLEQQFNSKTSTEHEK